MNNNFLSESDVAVSVDGASCRRLAALLAGFDVPGDQEERAPTGLSKEQAGNFFLALVAICHQTSPLGSRPLEGYLDGKRIKGWDYLYRKFHIAAASNPKLIDPSHWTQLNESAINTIFRDDMLGVTLTDPSGRSALLRNLGEVMIARQWRFPADIHDRCEGRISTGVPNLLEEFWNFRAYNDPIYKKTLFFLTLMKNNSLWHYADEENLGSPVDYHEVRGHLRLGTIVVDSPLLRKKLLSKSNVSAAEDLAIRKAVYDAMMLISTLSEISPSRLHYLFWNVFRSCCTRESPHCRTCSAKCPLPSRYFHLGSNGHGQRRCPFSLICPSASLSARYYEHVFATDWY